MAPLYGWSARLGSTLKQRQEQVSEARETGPHGEPVPAINQWYGYFRINVSDTGNDFSSIIRGLNIVRYSTFREIETHGAGQVRMASCTTENQVCFIQSHFYSNAEHSTTENFYICWTQYSSFLEAPLYSEHGSWWYDTEHRTSIGNSKQALGQYISMRHFMNANLNQIHCNVFT